MQNEIWKPVKGYEGKYSVSNKGNIKTEQHLVNHIHGKRIVKEKVRPLQNHNQGYLCVSLGNKSKLVHRLVAESFIDNLNDYEFVNHKDGNKKNNCVENLEWCTRQENEKHAFDTGLKNSTGSHNTMAKLNEGIVKRIKYIEVNEKSSILSDKYGVTIATINRIKNNVIWKRV